MTENKDEEFAHIVERNGQWLIVNGSLCLARYKNKRRPARLKAEAINQALKSQGWVKRGFCEWGMGVEMDDEKWDAGCGQSFCFIDSGPKENEYKFCPNCGGTIKIKEEASE